MKAALTPARLAELFWYDANGGELIRRISMGRGGRFAEGEVAGSLNGAGYLVVTADGVRLLAHRVAFAIAYGQWPQGQIDHIDGDRTNNRLLNMRDVPAVVNCQNQRRARGVTASGLLGVSRQRSRWKAEIKVNGKKRYLGAAATPEEAHALYVEAKRLLHEGNTL